MDKKNNETLFEKLNNYADKKIVPMHMPGHKRNSFDTNYLKDISCKLDITEIDGFDNLHNANGILKDSMQIAAELWKSKQSYFLVNGSTCGILASIRAACKSGNILIARNCHKSVYHAIEVCNLNAHYIYPEMIENFNIFGSISPENVETILKNNCNIDTVIITSPTYEGVISDIKSISSICHKHNAILIVDEAHGAHLDLSSHFQGSAVNRGADIVIQSLHKTLPSLTQTAILHICSERISQKEIERQLRIFETSSPSYILLSSIDGCVRLLSKDANHYFESWHRNIELFHDNTKNLNHLKILKQESSDLIYNFDKSKIVISCSDLNLTGKKLMILLREYHGIELEMAYNNYAIAMTGLFDDSENFKSLYKALLQIDKQCQNAENSVKTHIAKNIKSIMKINDAFKYNKKIVFTDEAIGKISAEYIWAYPPGIPYVVPGEVISSEIIAQIQNAKNNGAEIISDFSNSLNNFSIIESDNKI